MVSDWMDKFQKWAGNGYDTLLRIGKALLVILLAIVMVKVGSFVIRKIFGKQRLFRQTTDMRKFNTMSTLLVSVFRYFIYIVAGIVILSDIFDVTSVLAAAGVGGIAVGFGAQGLIKDVIAGFFVVMEDQYSVGELITIGNMTGTVEEIGLRMTRLRSFNGDLHIIPNGEVKSITNHARGNRTVLVDIPLSYSVDTSKAFATAEKACALLKDEFPQILEGPSVLGITGMEREGMNLRIMAKTPQDIQWEVERRIRAVVKEEFTREGIRFFEYFRIDVGSDRVKGGEDNA